jgi:glycosyltransferase involved in cell wall biosynthesis
MNNKIVWLCAFSNYELAQIIDKNIDFKTVSPWINDFINLFRKNNNINIYIISPNYINNKNISLKIDNIKVHLFKFHSNYVPEKFYNFSFNYPYSKNNIISIINNIQPDLIHLFGAENPVYASVIVNHKFSIPILVSPQAFIRNSPRTNNLIKNFIRWNRIRYETKILQEQFYFTTATEDVDRELNIINPNCVKFRMPYPTSLPENIYNQPQIEKIYDLSFFGQISKEKGIEDFLEILIRIKKDKPNINAVIIGGGSQSYINFIKNKIKKLGLSNNIHFAGFQKTQTEAFNLLVKSKINVLPTYFDGLPGTIRESMFLKVAVIAYAVGGIPRLNDIKECVKCVPVHDIEALYINVTELLFNFNSRQILVNNAFSIITQNYNNDDISRKLLDIYKFILE